MNTGIEKIYTCISFQFLNTKKQVRGEGIQPYHSSSHLSGGYEPFEVFSKGVNKLAEAYLSNSFKLLQNID